MTAPSNRELFDHGYRISPPYREGDPLPTEFVLSTPDGREFRSRADTTLWALARRHFKLALIGQRL
jgi:hypothetical protein